MPQHQQSPGSGAENNQGIILTPPDPYTGRMRREIHFSLRILLVFIHLQRRTVSDVTPHCFKFHAALFISKHCGVKVETAKLSFALNAKEDEK